MTTTTIANPIPTVNASILVLDLGKYKSVSCYWDHRNPVRFETFLTGRAELLGLLDRYRPATVVIEACALSGWVHDLCAERGLVCKVANTATQTWKFKHLKRKTDQDDALRLAHLEALGQLPTVPIPPLQTRQWRALIGYRQALVRRRVARQNRLRALFLGQGLPAPRGHRAWTAAGLDGLAQHAKPLAECGSDELWRGLLHLDLTEYRPLRQALEQIEARLDALAAQDEGVRLLETIPGVGTRTAEVIVAHLHQAQRFQTGKQVSAYAGLVPKQLESGETDRRGRITRRGPALLRKLLVECAWVMLRSNSWARAVSQRLSRGKARKKQAIVALARASSARDRPAPRAEGIDPRPFPLPGRRT
jgi:transposase